VRRPIAVVGPLALPIILAVVLAVIQADISRHRTVAVHVGPSESLSDTQAVPVPIPVAVRANGQALVSSHPPGTTFLIEAGVHRRWSVRPKRGDTFKGQPGAVLDGRNTTSFAFDGSASDITIEGTPSSDLVIRNYSNGHRLQTATINTNHARSWTLRDLDVGGSWYRGIALGDGMTIDHCNIHDNGQLGIGGPGTDIVIEHSRIDHNGFHRVAPGAFEAGGIKTVARGRMIVEFNDISDNGWTGLWTDLRSHGVVVEHNTISGNQRSGIHFEVSLDQLAEDNVLSGNVGPAVVISGSRRIRIWDNTITGNRGGIQLNEWGRSPGLDFFTAGDNIIVNSGLTGSTETNPPHVHVQFVGNKYKGTNTLSWNGMAGLPVGRWRALGFA
jgi:hypothetical protein